MNYKIVSEKISEFIRPQSFFLGVKIVKKSETLPEGSSLDE
jgi:hypothetical protein